MADSLDPELSGKLQELMKRMADAGHPVKITGTTRTEAQQNKLYKQGRGAPGNIVTEVDGTYTKSRHQLGRAADLWFVKGDGPWDLLGQHAKDLGLEWGGDWKTLVDRPHVQLPNIPMPPEAKLNEVKDTVPPKSTKKAGSPFGNPFNWKPQNPKAPASPAGVHPDSLAFDLGTGDSPDAVANSVLDDSSHSSTAQQYKSGDDVTHLMNPSGTDVTALMNGGGSVPEPPTGFGGTATGISKDKGWMDTFRDSIPTLAAAGAGTAMGIAGTPAIPAIAAAGLVGAGAKGFKDLWRFAQGTNFDFSGDGPFMTEKSPEQLGHEIPEVPSTYTQAGLEAGIEGVTAAAGEAGAQGLGYTAMKAGNVLARPGAAARNEKLIEGTVNPTGRNISPELGRDVQKRMVAQRRVEKRIVQEGQDQVLSQSQLGNARPVNITHETPATYAESINGRTVDIGEEGFTAGEVGPTAREAHRVRMGARTGGPTDKAALAQIKAAAQSSGLSTDRYMQLEGMLSQIMERHDAPFTRQLRKKGSDVIGTLTNPQTWRTHVPEGSEIPLDSPELMDVLRQNIRSPEMWNDLKIAVSKRIVKDSSDINGNLVPGQLRAKLQALTNGRAQELVPAHDALVEIAQVLDRNSGHGGVPHRGTVLTVLDMALRHMHLDTPDIGRLLRQQKNGGDMIEKFTEHVIRAGMGAGRMTAEGDSTSTLPEPPQGVQ